VKAPKILAVASAVDLDFRYGCTPAWWQLWKGLYEAGCDLIVTPYRGRPVDAPWWRTEPNPCFREAELFAGARDTVARLKRDTHLRRAEEEPPDSASDKLVRRTIWSLVTPRWRRHLERILERERDVDAVLQEVDRLIARGVTYIYFIDEIFGVGRNVHRLLEQLADRRISIGLQTRIDLWDENSLDLLGRAHCISMECGIESITDEGRDELNKNCRLTTDRLTELLIHARTRVPWVQANLILTEHDQRTDIRRTQQFALSA